MPIYEYKCTFCGAVVNELRSYAEMSREDKCPRMDCGGVLKKQLTVGSVLRSPNVPN